VSPPLLDPKFDLVFKLLLQDDLELARAMIEDVLDLPGRIRTIELLNAEGERDAPSDKGIVLDVRIDVEGLGRVDIEMQCAPMAGHTQRFLYYWAREYSSLLKRGESYTGLVPVISILWLDYTLFPDTPFHSIFEVRERASGKRYSDHLQIHTLELPKQPRTGDETLTPLGLWSRFFSGSDEERHALAEKSDTMRRAMANLIRLSGNEHLQELARDRERDRLWSAVSHLEAKKEGIREGIEQGIHQGMQQGMQQGIERGAHAATVEMVLSLMHQRFGTLSEDLSARVNQADLAQLKQWLTKLLSATAIDDVFR
jgi:predicted transposase/invertase (TIGR01784 family)